MVCSKRTEKGFFKKKMESHSMKRGWLKKHAGCMGGQLGHLASVTSETALGELANGRDSGRQSGSEGQGCRLYLGFSAPEFMSCPLFFAVLSSLGTLHQFYRR